MKIAIVTGASSGIGLEFVKQIAASEDLDEIWVIARRYDRLEKIKLEISEKIRPIPLDLLQEQSIYVLKELLNKEEPEIKILVNSSGFGKYGTYKDLTEEEIDSMIDLNCKALIHMTYACLPYMKAGDRVIMMGSSSAFQPLPEFILYASTKVFVVHFSRALNVELKSRGISVTTVCPGYVRTEFFEVAKETKNPDTCQNFKPMYEPQDVVRKALRDSRKGKDMSVLGLHVKLLQLMSKLLPHKLVMKVWLKIK
ncbi:SDR family NAD(P)-dependent oxidoreductase [Clostridium sp. 19966]|uniref:SDR family NAD(P)-dependent oxidoreductase n=1 Tax=Clostridium sp. 19966 TaxID=2768166 RepID=UPI0028DE3E8F|nr:SDR family NAD(P)-dependent oxidoreductase [Clostridium sp. 19966]MDT8718767.1 SDR family NAD(P)-dependent oxidoreductase [Clostridium sp. 19966]